MFHVGRFRTAQIIENKTDIAAWLSAIINCGDLIKLIYTLRVLE